MVRSVRDFFGATAAAAAFPNNRNDLAQVSLQPSVLDVISDEEDVFCVNGSPGSPPRAVQVVTQNTLTDATSKPLSLEVCGMPAEQGEATPSEVSSVKRRRAE